MLSILEKTNSMPAGKTKEKKGGGTLSPAKPKSPATAKTKPTSPGKAKQTKGAEKEVKTPPKKEEKEANSSKKGAEKTTHSLAAKASEHSKQSKKAQSPTKKDKVPKSPVKSPKSGDKHNAKLEAGEKAQSQAKKTEGGNKSLIRGASGEATAQAENPKLMTKATAAEITTDRNATKFAAEEPRHPSPFVTSLASANPSSADEFGPYEPSIVAFSEPFDDDVDTSGSDFDLDFTDDEGVQFSDDDGEYFDFGD
ncbi:hypothetical protein niasHS_012311 [Heterodera schachtii]|uniref:Uncharacterized protein n=1 Tax=Heterodera schachtii TaxID=97005 RepID=A0ABD2IJK4_HETSC